MRPDWMPGRGARRRPAGGESAAGGPQVRDAAPQPAWTRALGLAAAACLLLVGIAVLAGQALAQARADWAEPVNVSRSGAASEPTLLALPGGTLRVLWWDQFEGLTVADGPLPAAAGDTSGEGPAAAAGDGAWSDPVRAPILMVQPGQEVTTPTPIDVMPRILGDAEGRAQAFWLGQPDEETGAVPLHYSRLVPGRLSWSVPLTLSVAAGAFDAAADPSGTLHLAYVQPAQVGRSPSGLYHRRSRDGGASWSAATIVQPSLYLRLLPVDGDALRLTAHSAVSLTVAWQDPRRGEVVVARSTDGGATWQAPRSLAAADGLPLAGRAVSVPGQPARVTWPLPGEAGGVLAAAGAGDALALALWDGERWAAAGHLALDLEAAGSALRLDAVEPVFAAPAAEAAAGSLAVIGSDPQGDLWVTALAVEALPGLLAWPAEGEVAAELSAVNLSRSGAASAPAVVAGPDGRLHAFWWDGFEGLMTADGVVSATLATSGTDEIVALRDAWSPPRPVPLPVTGTPWLLPGTDGTVHALWQQAADEGPPTAGGEVARPLLYSQLAADGIAWTTPQVLAASALAVDVTGGISNTLHLAYLVGQDTPGSPAGVYYRRSGEDGAGWGTPTLVYTSPGLRLLTAEDAHLRLAAAADGGIYLAWDDPQRPRSLLAISTDGGVTWGLPVEVGDPEEELGSRRARPIAPAGGDVLLVWEPGQAAGTCLLFQAPVAAVLDDPAGLGAGEQILETLASCPQAERFLALGDGQGLLLAGSGSDALTLALWDGERWSEPTRWGAGFEDPETGRAVYLGGLQAVLLQAPLAAAGGPAAGALVAVGTDGAGDVWATTARGGDLTLVFAPPPAWSSPAVVSEGEAYPGLPASAIDAQGWLHAVWSEALAPGEPGTALTYARWDGTAWSRPATVLVAEEGKADEPALLAVGDRLHAVWSSGRSGEVLYSRAFAGDAYAAGGWSDPFPLPAPGEVGSRPDIAAGPDGSLHVVLAVPVNEGRGIYYTHSADGGETWEPVRQVFDAAAAGWLMAGSPQLAVDAQGGLHVAWVRSGLPTMGQAQGVYYAGSADGGQTWSAALEVAAGTHAWPQVATGEGGQVHLVWHEAGAQPAWWHRRSLDGGQTWTRQERISGLDGVGAPAALLQDAGGALHLLGLAPGADAPALLLTSWDGQRWSPPETLALDAAGAEPGLAAALRPDLGRLEVLFRAGSGVAETGGQPAVWHTGRQVPAVSVGPPQAAAGVPLPAVPTAAVAAATGAPPPAGATPLPGATPQPTAGFSTAPPPAGGSSLPVPVLLAGVLAALVVGGGLGWSILSTRRITGKAHYRAAALAAGRRGLEQLRRALTSIKQRLPRAGAR